MNRPIDRLRNSLEQTTRRSGFAQWLARDSNFADFEATRSETGIRWEAVAKWAAEEGLVKQSVDGDKKTFTAAAAKRAYEREKARRRGATQEATVKATTGRQTPIEGEVKQWHPSVRILPPPEPEPEKSTTSRNAQEFLESMKPAHLRKKPEPQPEAPTPASPVLDEINRQLDAGKWLPNRRSCQTP